MAQKAESSFQAEIRMYEYKVIPSPLRTAKVKGLKTVAERFAHMLEEAMNSEALDGWEFLRSETLPCEERKGLTGTTKSFQSVLVFRRALHPGEDAHADTFDTDTDHAGNGPAADDADTPADEGAPRLSLVATRPEAEAPAPQPAAPPSARQEPVLRLGAGRTPPPSDRPEPVLRTRVLDEND